MNNIGEHMSAFDISCWVVAVVFASIVNLWIITIWYDVVDWVKSKLKDKNT
jgi:hypothetical protein